MPKRFTATEKWDDPWFFAADNNTRMLWQFLLDKCDHAGVWDTNWPLAEVYLRFKPTPEMLGDRIVTLQDGKIFLPKFLTFQYGRLRKNNSTHISVLARLEKYNLMGYAPIDDGEVFGTRAEKDLRGDLYKRFRGACAYCGTKISELEFQIDHMRPTSKGGSDSLVNLALTCVPCNTSKTTRDIDEFISSSGFDKALVMKRIKGALKDLESPSEGPKDKEKDKDREKDKERIETDFARFWELYPRKKAKKKAWEAWSRLAPDAALVARIMESLGKHARSEDWARDGGKFIPHPATWLNGERWNDQVASGPVIQPPQPKKCDWCYNKPRIAGKDYCGDCEWKAEGGVPA